MARPESLEPKQFATPLQEANTAAICDGFGTGSKEISPSQSTVRNGKHVTPQLAGGACSSDRSTDRSTQLTNKMITLSNSSADTKQNRRKAKEHNPGNAHDVVANNSEHTKQSADASCSAQLPSPPDTGDSAAQILETMKVRIEKRQALAREGTNNVNSNSGLLPPNAAKSDSADTSVDTISEEDTDLQQVSSTQPSSENHIFRPEDLECIIKDIQSITSSVRASISKSVNEQETSRFMEILRNRIDTHLRGLVKQERSGTQQTDTLNHIVIPVIPAEEEPTAPKSYVNEQNISNQMHWPTSHAAHEEIKPYQQYQQPSLVLPPTPAAYSQDPPLPATVHAFHGHHNVLPRTHALGQESHYGISAHPGYLTPHGYYPSLNPFQQQHQGLVPLYPPNGPYNHGYPIYAETVRSPVSPYLPPVPPQGMSSSSHSIPTEDIVRCSQTDTASKLKRIRVATGESLHCHQCGTSSTPEWRRGPKGLRTLCNACGLYHAKMVRKKGETEAARMLRKRSCAL